MKCVMCVMCIYVEHCNGGKLVLLFIIISCHAVARICPEGVRHECLALVSKVMLSVGG